MKRYADIAGDGGSQIVAQVGAQQARLAAGLRGVRRILAISSGKGGVGKSALTVNLAAALAAERDGVRIGVLDADLNGPSVARMMGVRDQTPRVTEAGVAPATGPLGIKVLSMDLFLRDEMTPVHFKAPTQQDAYVWRRTLEMTALREMLGDTEWGELDCLLVDLPPGPERLPDVAGLLTDRGAALAVTVPSRVSQVVVQRALVAARAAMGERLLGLVDNMAGYTCGHCGVTGDLFPRGESEAVAAGLGVPYLGGIPFDPRLAAACDGGEPFVLQAPEAPAARAVRAMARRLSAWLDASPAHRRTELAAEAVP